MHMIPPLLLYESSFTTVTHVVVGFFYTFPLVMNLQFVVCESD